MTVRYGVVDAYSCGARTVTYTPSGCEQCLPIKIGEKQIFDVDYSSEVKCNPRRVGCRVDYNELVGVTNFSVVPETVFGQGSIAVSVAEIDERGGVVKLLVDATDPLLQADEKWQVSVTADLENGTCLKQCFQIRLIPCSGSCEIEGAPSSKCCGPILKVQTSCGEGTFFIYDTISLIPSKVDCVEFSTTCDVLYTLDGTSPSDPAASAIPLAAGIPKQVCNDTEMNGLRVENADGSCSEICVTVTYRGA